MRYLLKENYALRSFQNGYFCLIRRDTSTSRRIDILDYLFLKTCDGLRDLPDSPFVQDMLSRRLIRPAEAGETLSPWQRPKVHDHPFFPEMNWMMTGKCNYNCLHCFNAADNAPLQAEWTAEEAERLLNEAADCGILRLTLTGGEPMLHPRFMDIFRGIYARGMSVHELNTNGYFITEDVLEEMKAAGGSMPLMKISLDGLGTHDWMRNRPGAEKRTLEAIRLCLENGFRVMIQMNANRSTRDALLPTLARLDEMGVQSTRIIRTSEAPRWLENAPEMTLSPREYFDLMLEVAAAYIAEPRRMTLNIWQLGFIHPRTRSFSLRAVACPEGTYRDTAFACPDVRKMIAVTAEGEVVPCMQCSGYFQAHDIHVANVKKQHLAAILADPRFMRMVDVRVKDIRERIPECGKCEWFEYCTGGCRPLATITNGNPLTPDPTKCMFFREGYLRKTLELLASWRNETPVDKIPQ